MESRWTGKSRLFTGETNMTRQGFTLTSPAFVRDGLITPVFTCDGENTSPPLDWMHSPEAARSFVLIVDDPDAPSGTFTHWVLFDIPADTKSLPGEVSDIGIKGRNDFQQVGYGGPCPPPNHGRHRYYFKLFALDVQSLKLAAGATRDEVEAAMEGHVLDQAELMGRYERKTG
jgi:Raf kinase inhibitor-like YbhB/YbcL family protein